MVVVTEQVMASEQVTEESFGLGLRVKEPGAPGTLGQEKACQHDPRKSPTLLLLHLSNQDHHW